jgi:tetratricopeptide (TPR) repeat protein
MQICPECLYPNQPEAERCESCGFRFESSAPRDQTSVSGRDITEPATEGSPAGGEEQVPVRLDQVEDPVAKRERLVSNLEETEARRDWTTALKILAELSALPGDRSGLVDKRLELERLLEEQGREEEWQAAEKRRWARRDDFLRDGRKRLAERLWSEAASAFQNVLEIETGHVEAGEGLGLAEKQRARLSDLSHEADEGERKGNLVRALAALEDMIALSPERDKVPERRDRVQRRWEEQRLLEDRKRGEAARQAEMEVQLRLGRMEFKNCNWAEAVAAFDRVLDLSEEDEEARLLLERARNYQAKLEQLTELADRAEAEGDLEKAVFVLEEMKPLLPEDAPIRARLTNLTRDLNKHRKNEKSRLEEDRRLARIRAILDQGLAKMRSRDYVGATHLFEQVVRLDETNEEARSLLRRIEANVERRHGLSRAAEAAAGEGRFEEAAELLRELLEITPEPETVRVRLAQAEARLGEVRRKQGQKAEKNRRRAESAQKIEQGKNYVRARIWAKAAVSFQEALELDQSNDEARTLLRKTEACRARLAKLAQAAKTAKSSGDLAGAISALEHMKPLVGNVEFIQEKIDELTRRQGEAPAPVATPDQGRQDRFRELVREGESRLREKRWRAAVGVLGQALDLEPEHEQANRLFHQAEKNRQRLEEVLLTADRAESEGRLHDAVEALEDSLPLLPETADVLSRKRRLEQEIMETASGPSDSWPEPGPAYDREVEPEPSELPDEPRGLGYDLEDEADWVEDRRLEPEESWPTEAGSGQDDEPGWEAERVGLGRSLFELVPRGRRKVWVMYGLLILLVIGGLIWNLGNFEPKAPTETKPAAAQSVPAPAVQPAASPQSEVTDVDLTPLFAAASGAAAAKALALEEWSAPSAGLTPDHPVWPQYLYLLGEVHRLRGDLKQASQAWQTLVDWAAGLTPEQLKMAGNLPLAALWRLLESDGIGGAAESGEVKALLDKAAALKSAVPAASEDQAPDPVELPQVKVAIYGYLTTLVWKAGDKVGARTLVEEYITTGDPEKLNPSQQEALKSAVSSGAMTEAGLKLKKAERLEELRRYDRALVELAEAAGTGSEPEKQAALVRRGVILHKTGAKPEQVLEILEPLAEAISDQELLQEVMYYRARQFIREGPRKDPERYLRELAALAERFPSGRLTDDALLRRGVYYLDQGQTEAGLAAFKSLREFTGVNDYEDSARYKPAMYLYNRGRAGDLDQAYQLLEDLVQARPDGPLKRTALFWLGRIAEESGRTTEAEGWFKRAIDELPYDFFANRARMHLNQGPKAAGLLWPDDRTMAELRTAFEKGRVPSGITGSSPAHIRLQQALKTGLYREAVAAEMALRQKFPETQNRNLDLGDLDKSGLLPKIVVLSSLRQDAYLARAADPTVENRLGIVSGVGRGAGDWLCANNLLWSPREPGDIQSAVQRHPNYPAVAYPGVYRDIIEGTAKKYQVEPELLYGVIRLESGFYPGALSSASALGLFQFMPKTFETLDKRWNILADRSPRNRTAYLLNPELNIDLGGRWFAQELLPRTGNMLWALAEHNAGYGAVKRWIGQWKGRGRDNDVEYMVETIDYLETKGFAKEVLNGITMAKSVGLFETATPAQPATSPSTLGETPPVKDE